MQKKIVALSSLEMFVSSTLLKSSMSLELEARGKLRTNIFLSIEFCV